VGKGRAHQHLGRDDLRGVLRRGAAWAVGRGLGEARDLEPLEDGGCFDGADPAQVSDHALARGAEQLGTLGSGNHFAEVQYVDEIYDAAAARAFGLALDGVTIMIHSGSRGLGHQVCTDHLKTMLAASSRYGIELPDRQLCCAPIRSPEGERYLGAMAAAANFAFANRQAMTHWVRESFGEALGSAAGAHIDVIYDVCHNTAKFETFVLDGERRRVCVHRKGATRAYPPGHPDVPVRYRAVGQPVLIPGDMGRYSFVLAGTQGAFEETFGSTCHGAGRAHSRGAMKRMTQGRDLFKELEEERGVIVMAHGRDSVAEEMPEAYKDASLVVDVMEQAGVTDKVARLRPLGCIKG
jgi:tRNA-splicing ligase RtcB